jgi:two-component system response regulator PhoP
MTEGEMMASRSAGRVLIVETDGETRELLVGFFRANGYDVDEAADGEEGLYRVHDAAMPHDVVLLADQLPDATAREMLPALLALQPGARVVVMSAATRGAARYETIGGGAYDVIRRPPWLRDALRIVTRAVEAARVEAEALLGAEAS